MLEFKESQKKERKEVRFYKIVYSVLCSYAVVFVFSTSC